MILTLVICWKGTISHLVEVMMKTNREREGGRGRGREEVDNWRGLSLMLHTGAMFKLYWFFFYVYYVGGDELGVEKRGW